MMGAEGSPNGLLSVKCMPPPSFALFPVIVTLFRVGLEWNKAMPPPKFSNSPSPVTLLLLMITLFRVGLEVYSRIPPLAVAVFPVIVR